MAWPATVNPGDTATAAQYNALVAALKTWGGNVDGGNFALSNVASISAGAGGITTTGNLNGIYKPATASVVGGVKIGANVTVAGDGTISVAAPTAPYTLPVATTSVLGGVKQGSGVAVAGDGTLSRTTSQPYVEVSTSYQATAADYCIVSTASGNITITTPGAPIPNQVLAIKNSITTGIVTVACPGADNIEGVATKPLYPGQAIIIQRNAGGVWMITAETPSAWMGWNPAPLAGDAGVTVTLATNTVSCFRVDRNVVEINFFFNLTVNANSGKITFTLPLAAAPNSFMIGFAGAGTSNIPAGVVAIDNLSASGAQNEQGHIQTVGGTALASIYPSSPAGTTVFGTARSYAVKGALRYAYRL